MTPDVEQYFRTLLAGAPAEMLHIQRDGVVVGPVAAVPTPWRREHTKVQGGLFTNNETCFIVRRSDLGELFPPCHGDRLIRVRDAAAFEVEKQPDWRFVGPNDLLVRIYATGRKSTGAVPAPTGTEHYVVVATSEARDALPFSRRRALMVVAVASEKAFYLLTGSTLDNAGWLRIGLFGVDGHGDLYPVVDPDQPPGYFAVDASGDLAPTEPEDGP